LIVPLLDTDAQPHLAIAFYTKNMRVFIQGTNITKWIDHNFMAIKQRLDHVDGISKSGGVGPLTVELPPPRKGKCKDKNMPPSTIQKKGDKVREKKNKLQSVVLPPTPVLSPAQHGDVQGKGQSEQSTMHPINLKDVYHKQPKSVALPPMPIFSSGQAGNGQEGKIGKCQQFVKLPSHPVYGTGKGVPTKKPELLIDLCVEDTAENLLNNTMSSVSSMGSTESVDSDDQNNTTAHTQPPDPPQCAHDVAVKLNKIKLAHNKAMNDLKEKVAHLEIELSKKDIDLEKLRKVESENKSIKNTLTKQKREINKLTNRVDDLLKSNSALKSENCELSERNQQLKKENDRVTDQPDVIYIANQDKSADGPGETVKGPDNNDSVTSGPPEQEEDGFQQVENNKRKHRKKPQKKNKKTKPDKVKIVVCGDSNVRGLGSLIQGDKVDGMAVVHPGFKIQDMKRHMSKSITNDTDMIFLNCGTNNIEQGDFIDTVCKFDSLIDNASKSYENKEIVMLAVPPAHKAALQNKIKDINDYLYSKCKRYNNVIFLDCGLNQAHLEPDGIHLNKTGKSKVGTAIVQHAESRV
jgi:hypothetical protein